ncbi:glycosyltransferase family 39 protein [Paludisphaera rhizosphaerae]|uniref:glycosyltransferase family 39 protein n=1 Tax=Paludisphaera rhizosphaerae TaxID=2711216 RepID=UPI0013ECB6A4|nr:glycosyltransferase family 39 protein [Paludisphaera rhizosphaerae]
MLSLITPHNPSVGDAGSTFRWTPAAVLVLALTVRVAWGLSLPVVPLSDCMAYDLQAHNLANGVCYGFEASRPSAYWPVGTSAVYAALYTIFGFHYGPIVVMNILIGVATTWLVMATTRDWFGPRAALAAGLLTALWPGQIQFTTILASELLFNLFVLLAVYVEGRNAWPATARAVATGASLACASYIRPLALPLPALFWFRRLVDPQERRQGVASNTIEAAGVLLVMAVLIAPWTVRNYRTFGYPVLISTNGGANFWMGNNPESDGGYMPLPKWAEDISNEAEADRALKRAAWRFIMENPRVFFLGLFRKAFSTYSRESIGVAWNEDGLKQVFGAWILTPMKLVSALYFAGAMLAAFAGAYLARRGRSFLAWATLPPVMLWAFFAAIHIVIVGGDRYHYPSLPMIASLAGLGLVAQAVDRRSTKSDQTAVGSPTFLSALRSTSDAGRFGG